MTRSEGRSAGAFVVLLLMGLLCSFVRLSSARAAERDEAGARVLFGEGRKLADVGRYAEACLKFEESLRLDPGVGTSFNLADCQEHLGRTASAWARFLDVAAATKLGGQPERERVARARAAALEPKLARLTVEVHAPVEGLVVTRDGLAVGAAAWGIPVPVDPGPHTVEARAPGRKEWSRATLVESGPSTQVVSVPALEAVPQSERAATSSSLAPAGQSPLTLALAEPPRAEPVHRRWLPIVGLGAVTAAGAVAAILLGREARAENAKALQLCTVEGTTCLSSMEMKEHSAHVSNAKRDQALAFASAGVGVAALLGAAYLWWRPTHASAGKSSLRVSSPSAGPHGTLGAQLSWTW